VTGAPKLQHFDRPPALFLLQNVSHDDYVVGDKLFHAETGYFAVFLGAFRRHNNGNTHFLKPCRYPEQLAADQRLVVELAENGPQRID
jgi:hypothetical protein